MEQSRQPSKHQSLRREKAQNDPRSKRRKNQPCNKYSILVSMEEDMDRLIVNTAVTNAITSTYHYRDWGPQWVYCFVSSGVAKCVIVIDCS
mmetsp:Transcript_16527/g.45545  ORF Transcript_16527/g.45545 Transcript_16527/m.45545 type:complete len:91 (+) Transcript_16527:783-1055(+)